MSKTSELVYGLRTIRERSKLTREQLAFHSGVSTSTVTRMELKGHIPSGAALISISKTLGISIDSLVSSIKNSQSSSSVTDVPTGTRSEEERFTSAGDAA